MKATSISSMFLGIFAATALAQELAPAVEATSVAIAPVAAGDGAEVPAGEFPVPTEMQKREVNSSRLDKRHYGVF